MPFYGDIKKEQADAACNSHVEMGANVAGLAAGTLLKVAPVTGAVYGAINTGVKVGRALHDGNVGKAASEFVAGAANTAVSIFAGGLAGDAATEAVRQGVGVVAGENSMPDKSGIRTLVDDMRCVSVAPPAAPAETPSVSPSSDVPAPKQHSVKQLPTVKGWRTTVTM